MTKIPQQTGSFSVNRGEVIFTEGEAVKALCLLLQGKADIYVTPFENEPYFDPSKSLSKNFRICSEGQSIFIGGTDLFLSGNHSYSCKASEDSNLFAFSVQSADDIKTLISTQKDYGAYIVNSLCTLIENSYSSMLKIKTHVEELRILTENLAICFWHLKEKYNFEYTPDSRFLRDGLDLLQNLKDAKQQIYYDSTLEFFEKDFSQITNSQAEKIPADLRRIDYYAHLGNLATDLRKNFFSADPTVTCFHCNDAAEFFDHVTSEIKDYFIEARNSFTRLYSDNGECIFTAFTKAAEEIASSGNNTDTIYKILDYIVSKINETVNFYKLQYFHDCETDLEYIKCACLRAKSTTTSTTNSSGQSGAASGSNTESIPEELRNSARTLVEYSEISEEKANVFLMNLFSFRNLADRLSTNDDVREIRNAVASQFFEIYEAIFKKAHASNEKSRLIDMFLMFGYMDEKLLTTEQVLTLYRLAGKQAELSHESIYTIKDWFEAICNKQREPSISEFGQDYNDIFREMKKRKEVTDKDKSRFDNDVDAKITHEVTNLFKINHKLCHGQINVYFPVLHSEIITKDLTKALVTAEQLTESINKVLEVDFSAFHRELNYRDTVSGIEKELIMKPVFPDIILVPTFGCRAIMWQEISVRNRSNPGRFILPIFTDESIDDLILKLIGNFRWELCRTIMGSAWNDVTVPSLTAEYSDYVQFFKKNKDLTDEAKEKLKTQIQKYHGKSRDIFTADYETWVKYESKGGIRLNKTVRSIMYRYCPLSKPLREHLDKSPIYADIAVKFNFTRKKLARELEGRYGRYAKSAPLDPDLKHNLQFYKEL